ncbi:MAG: globin [Armatimonadota bacterium]
MIPSTPAGPDSGRSVWEQLGGTDGGAPEAFAALVDAFYDRVMADALLAPMYPSDSEALADSRENLALFLIQYFGGPALYAMKRGHPRLRMRHMPYAIGRAERDAWLAAMDGAVASVPELAPVAESLQTYFAGAAEFLRNRDA